MFEVGDKVVCVETSGYSWLTVGKVYTVDGLWDFGIYFIDDKGDLVGMCSEYFKPHTETEAERRGAKFGVMGIVKNSGVVSPSSLSVRFISDKNSKNTLGETLWDVVNESGVVYPVHPANIRLDHEPEFVAWSEAPEHLRYDASRVYFDGKPVKWIAKPEGSNSGVAYVDFLGTVMGSSSLLTVKL